MKTAKVRRPPAAAAAAICKHSSFRVSLELLLLLLLAQFALLPSERQLDKLSYHTNSIRLNESDISIISADTERRRPWWWCQQQLHSTRQMWPWSEKGANEQTNQSKSKREVCCCQTNTVCQVLLQVFCLLTLKFQKRQQQQQQQFIDCV